MNVDIYCIDTSSILEAWVRTYPRDIFPGFWINLQELIDSGRLISPEEVLQEIQRKEDDVAVWAKSQTQFFVPFDEHQEEHFITVMTDHALLISNTKRKHDADPFVIALAKTQGCAVITEERSGSLSKPKIPDVCKALGIDCFSVLDLMRREGWSY